MLIIVHQSKNKIISDIYTYTFLHSSTLVASELSEVST